MTILSCALSDDPGGGGSWGCRTIVKIETGLVRGLNLWIPDLLFPGCCSTAFFLFGYAACSLMSAWDRIAVHVDGQVRGGVGPGGLGCFWCTSFTPWRFFLFRVWFPWPLDLHSTWTFCTLRQERVRVGCPVLCFFSFCLFSILLYRHPVGLFIVQVEAGAIHLLDSICMGLHARVWFEFRLSVSSFVFFFFIDYGLSGEPSIPIPKQPSAG